MRPAPPSRVEALHDSDADWAGLHLAGFELHVTDGRTAARIAAERGCVRTAVMDLPLFTVWQGVCDESGADTAMKFGTNYPAGPFEWLSRVGVDHTVALLNNLFEAYRSERHRASLAPFADFSPAEIPVFVAHRNHPQGAFERVGICRDVGIVEKHLQPNTPFARKRPAVPPRKCA